VHYIVLDRQNAAAAAGSTATSTGEVTGTPATGGGGGGAAVVLRTPVLTPIAEHSPMSPTPVVKRAASAPPTRYFEPKVILH